MKGRVERSTIPCRINKTDNINTPKGIKNKETRQFKSINELLYDGKSYKEIATILNENIVDILYVYNKKTNVYNTISKINILDMIKKEVSIKEIAEFFKTTSDRVLLILNDLYKSKDKDIIDEVKLANRINDLLIDGNDFKYISNHLIKSEYELFTVYNKYFKKYSNEVVDDVKFLELIRLNLSIDALSKFYDMEKDKLIELKKLFEENQKRISINYSKDKQDIIDPLEFAYTDSNKIDFYDIGMSKKSIKKRAVSRNI